MKPLSIIGFVILAAAIAFLGIVAVDLHDRVTGLQNSVEWMETEIEELRKAEAAPGQGGVELSIDDIPTPIHPEDYIGPSSPFGPRRSPFTGELVYHPGLDVYGTWHARVLALGPGTVVEHWIPPGQLPGYTGHPTLGGCLVIAYDDGALMTMGHLSETYVHEGFRVSAGDVIARQGSTGLSTGEHVHVEIFRDGGRENPFVYLSELCGGPSAACK